MIAKVKGTDGSEKEIKIDPDKVDPSNASYVEMLALSAHLKQQGKIDSPAGGIVVMTMAKRVQEANARQGEIYDKSNFLSEMQNTLEDCLKNGLMDTYMRYIKEVGIYAAMTGRSAQAILTDRGISEDRKQIDGRDNFMHVNNNISNTTYIPVQSNTEKKTTNEFSINIDEEFL